MRPSIILVLLLSLSFQNLEAQNDEDREIYPEYGSLIKLSPFGFARSHFEVSYERYFKDRSKSLLISPTFMLKENSFESFKGIKLGLQFRIYLNNLNHRYYSTSFFDNIGYYAAPFVSGTIYSEDRRLFLYDQNAENEMEGNFTNDIRGGETGVILGGQFHLTPRFVLDLFAGGAIRYSTSKNNIPEPYSNQEYFYNNDTFDQGYTGIKPAGGFMIGFTF